MKYIGPHVSAAGGVQNAPVNANSVGASGFGMFTKNQRQWIARPLEAAAIDAFKKNMELYGYDARTVLPHNSYLINLCSPDEALREKSINALIEETRRCADLGLTMLNIHPGSSLNAMTAEESLAVVAESLNIVLDKTDGSGVTIVLETVAGQGSNIGDTFEQLAGIIYNVNDKARVGVCIDTCHIFAAGYDIRTQKCYDDTIRRFDQTVGLNYLRGLHLNDAKHALGSRLDRHESIGKGHLGLEAFRLFMQDPRLNGLPCVLETINEGLWADEVALLKKMSHDC